ncbi:hypothetical protein M8C17_24035 [Micromonospora sp. RHAY321]|uniref:hypothetical protein n=1 Tax=Micromonospora sp. RHAY321 TaxID=2944807 RepID=UPI00207C7085|nr:hypothetical protein [Micromonospora sp. RHAY321]MCO1598224.1 hypothetical protein [Micromonospora sp. RHAY321]
MGYDIGFLMPGQDDDRLSDELPLLQLTNEQEAAWRRIVARAQQEIGAAGEDRYPTHLELWLQNPAMQLCYAGNSASIEIPYRYTATAASAHAAIATAYALARIVEAETGMRGLDYEVNQAIQDNDLPRAVARYRGIGQHVRDLVTGQGPDSRSSDRHGPSTGQ